MYGAKSDLVPTRDDNERESDDARAGATNRLSKGSSTLALECSDPATKKEQQCTCGGKDKQLSEGTILNFSSSFRQGSASIVGGPIYAHVEAEKQPTAPCSQRVKFATKA